MNVSLPQDLEHFATERVASGDFASVSEVVCSGLRLLREQETGRRARLLTLRRDVGAGLAELDRGEERPGADVFDCLRRRREPPARS